MKSYQTSKSDEVTIVNRGKFLTLLQTALGKREFQFARQASLIWLASYPGDLLVGFVYASVLAELGDTEMAITNLEKIIRYDPEFTEATSLLSQLTNGEAIDTEYHSSLSYLQRNSTPVQPTAKWLTPLMNARQAFETGDQPNAEKSVLTALSYNPSLPLPAIMHMQVVQKNGNYTLLDTLASIYSNRWPDCIQIKLLSAFANMQQGDDSLGVEKLHWSAAHDVSGQVVTRLLGRNHAFKPIWPEDLKVYLDLPVPASVAVELGWNALSNASHGQPETVAEKQPAAQNIDLVGNPFLADEIPDFVMSEEVDYSEVPPESFLLSKLANFPESGPSNEKNETVESLNEIQAEFDKIAKHIRKSELLTADARFPNYVLLSSKTALVNKYGANTATVITDAMQDLSLKITALPNWNSLVFLPDDPKCTNELGLAPSLATDAWKIKLALADLDKKLAAKGEMIGALLIIGGNDIIPFHQLPNPTDDSDAYVASDNPYATMDENYFIQQWPVGRIPDEADNDAVYLLEQLRFLNNEYNLKVQSKTLLSGTVFENWFYSLSEYLSEAFQIFQKTENIGCCAEVWQIPSAEVFSAIDRSDRIKISPPTNSENFLYKQKSNPKYAYFNLHGLKDAPEWYGQRDLKQQSRDPEYPVALVPSLYNEKTPAPEFVMSEACYGANIIDKQASDSMALNFLATGSRCFVGSTCIAYGSVSKPLIAADLLAQDFWTHVQNGVSVGYALMRAKLSLASQMTKSQGYLDGEDQKTILSFVLYGDPLASKDSVKHIAKPLLRPAKNPIIKTISDSREELVVASEEMPDEILVSVKKVISTYLPGLDNATVAINPQLTNFTLDPHTIQDRKSHKNMIEGSERYVVTLKKNYEIKEINHAQYARITFDQKGEMIKLSTSR
ncbi:MAG: hypothetical protein WA110_00315 [Anaerolineaceae bacterium]